MVRGRVGVAAIQSSGAKPVSGAKSRGLRVNQSALQSPRVGFVTTERQRRPGRRETLTQRLLLYYQDTEAVQDFDTNGKERPASTGAAGRSNKPKQTQQKCRLVAGTFVHILQNQTENEGNSRTPRPGRIAGNYWSTTGKVTFASSEPGASVPSFAPGWWRS